MFTKALEFMKTYRTKREEALDNKSKQRWFTSDLGKLSELFTDTFDSKEENAAWSKAYEDGSDVMKTMAVRLKVHMLAGFRHDLRAQFAVGDAHNVKTAIDFDRHAVGELRAAAYRLELLKMGVEVKEGGVTTI